MKKMNRRIAFGWFVYAIAWFLPVHESGPTLDDGWLPGWQAAVGCLFGDLGPFGVVSSATNFIMLSTILLVLLPTRRRFQAGAWGCFLAAVLNASWIVLLAPDGGGLRAGYYLWTISFAVVGAGMWAAARRSNAHPSSAPAMA